MRILIYSLNFAPELTGIGKYSGEMAAWLASRGHQVSVVCAPPYYPSWKVSEGFSGRRYQRSYVSLGGAGLEYEVTRCPVWVPREPSGLKRLIHLATFALCSAPVLFSKFFWRPQVVFVVAPAFFCVPIGVLFGRLSKAVSWIHIQDFEVDAAFDLGMLKGPILRRAALKSESYFLKCADVVSSISNKMLERLGQKGVDSAAVHFFPNWVDVSHIGPKCSGTYFRELLRVADDRVVALYSGNMGAKQGLEVLSDAAKLLVNDSRILFVFCGGGGGRAQLEAECAGLPNVIFMDLQPLERLGDLLAFADIHLLPQRADAADLVMPSKLTGMLASGRPTIATANQGTELAWVVGECGLVVEPERPEALANAVLELAESPSRRVALGRRAREYAERCLDVSSIMHGFEEKVKAVVNGD